MTDHKISTRRKVAYFVGGGLLLVLLLAIGCEWAGWPFLRTPLIHVVETQLKRPVQIDQPFRLQLFGGIRLQVGHLQLSAPGVFEQPRFIEAHDLSIALRYRDLLNLQEGEALRIKEIRAAQLDANLIRLANGRATWQFELDERQPPRPFPVIETLLVQQGEAQIRDAISDARLTVTFNTEEGVSHAASLSKVAVKGAFRHRPLQGELNTHGFLPVATQGKGSPPINSQGWLTYGAVRLQFRGSVYDLFGEQKVSGHVQVSGASLADVGDLLDITLPRTPAFKVVADIDRVANLWEVRVASAAVGTSQLAGQFTYLTGTDKPMLRGVLTGRRLVLADLAPAFGASAAGQPAGAGRPGKVFPDQPLDFGSYDRMHADIDIHLDYVHLGHAFSEPIAPLKAHLSLLNNKLSLTGLDARTAQGSLAGDVFIDAHDVASAQLAHQPLPVPDWGVQLAVRDIRLEKWLNLAPVAKPGKANAPQAAAPQPYITGRLSGRAHLHGKGRSTATLLKTLDGQLALAVQHGEISHLVVEAAGLDIAQSVGLLIKGDQPLPMQCAIMGWNARQGILTPEAALVDTSVTTVVASGQVNLGQERLDLKLQANPKNFSPFTVRSPIYISGTFIDPKVSVGKGPIAARVAGGLVLALINPFAAILPFLDPGASVDAKNAGCQHTLQRLRMQHQ